eukprot:6140315-Pyramimonas_sp.AAC.1
MCIRDRPLSALLAGGDPSAVADDVGPQFRAPHVAEQRQSTLPLIAFLAGADPSAVADDVRFQLRVPHIAGQQE